MDDFAIKAEGVTKQYRLGTIGGGTLRGDLQSAMARLRGKDDPNAKIGAKAYAKNEKFLALDDVSFEVKPGEALGIIGHNGAGKSTLLKILSRVTAPTKGQIEINGRIASMLEVGTGFHPELTGRENVYLNGAILGMTKAEIKRKFDDIVEFAEMEQFIDTPVKRYSSGMYVKLAFSVAAHLDSEIMVMDEVLAVGDMKFQQKCLGKMGDAAGREGRTVLYVSHNMNTIRQLCTRCLVLDHGKKIFDGDTESAISLYSESTFNLYPSINYDNYTRQVNDYKPVIRIKNVNIENKTDNYYKSGEHMHMRIETESYKPGKNISLRFEIRTINDLPIGIFVKYDFSISAENKRECIYLDFNLSQLSPGKYKTFLVLFENISIDSGSDYDVVPCINFEIVQTSESIVWNTKNWGHIVFSEPQIKEYNIL